MEMLFDLLAAVGPAIAGVLTVPILQALKSASDRLDRAPALVKQVLGVLIAFGLTTLGGLLDVTLPGDLALFSGTDVEAAVAAAIAFAVHAGRKAKDNSPRTLE